MAGCECLQIVFEWFAVLVVTDLQQTYREK